MEGRVILHYKGLDAVVSHTSNPGIDTLLSSTILGTKGGMRYMLRDVPDRIPAYKNIRFVSLYRRKTLISTIGVCYREIVSAGNRIHGTYLRYLALRAGFQSAIESDDKQKRRRDKPNADSLKGQIMAYFRKPYLLDLPGFEEGDKNILYAYVESRNKRSRDLVSQSGFEHLRSFLTVAFSRFNPKDDKRVSKPDDSEKRVVKELLRSFYNHYSFFTEEFTFYNDNYYIIKDNNEILAGVSAVPTSYKIVDIPGLWGWMFMNVLHKLPVMRRLFRPGEFRFLVFSSLYFKTGYENDLEKLMESVLVREGINTALTWVDEYSDLMHVLNRKVNKGLLNRLLNPTPALLYASFMNYNDEEKQPFYENSAFISGFDFT